MRSRSGETSHLGGMILLIIENEKYRFSVYVLTSNECSIQRRIRNPDKNLRSGKKLNVNYFGRKLHLGSLTGL